MSTLVWDVEKERTYELGVDHGVLYLSDEIAQYNKAYVWNGLTAVNEAPEGGEPNDHFADNMKYFALTSAEVWNGSIEAYTYPDAFAECDGSAEVASGVYFGQQRRKMFGFSYRTKVGNAEDGDDAGYKLHLIYGCKVSPSDKGYETVNDSPEAVTFSWDVNSTPVAVPGYKAVSSITIDSTKADATKLKALEDILYGTDAHEAQDATYKETTDESPVTGKTYYTKSGSTYTEFTGTTFSSGTTYYEMVTPAVPASEGTAGRLPLPAEVRKLFPA